MRARLLVQARTRNEDFNRTLARYAAERWLYRLGVSPMRDRCILKGAALLAVWLPNPHRATRDVDLLTYGAVDTEAIREIVAAVCALEAPDDGLLFDSSDMDTAPIRPEEAYSGVRVRFWARLGRIPIRMQVDMGTGDAIAAGADEITYPTMLDTLPAPTLRAYPRQQSVAEKFEAMVKFDVRNSRMKDFHDVWALANTFAFDGKSLQEAVVVCFDRRGTSWTEERPVALTPAFYAEDGLQARWRGYLRGGSVLVSPSGGFHDVGEQIVSFLGPIRDSIVSGGPYMAHWPPSGPWRQHSAQ